MTDTRKLQQRIRRLEQSRHKYRELAQQLLKERKLLSSIIENAPYGVCINKNKFGKITYVNREFSNITGYAHEEIPTVSAWSYRAYPNVKYRHRLASVWRKMLESKRGSAFYRVVCKDGSVKDLETSLVVLKDKTVVNMFADVTRRELAEAALKESEAEFRLFFEKSPDAVLLLRGNRIIDCNQAVLTVLGCEDKILISQRTPRALFPGRQPDGSPSVKRFKEMVDTALKTRAHRFEWTMKKLDGGLFLADVILTALRLRGRQIIYMVLRDITAHKNAERALKKIKDELEARVLERTSELLTANRKMSEEIELRERIEEQLQKSRQELRSLSEHLQSAQEQERARIAREVHDELGQLLSALKIDINCLGRRFPKGNPSLREENSHINERIDTAIQAVRDICAKLRPTMLEHFGLAAAIEWQLKDLQQRTGIHYTADLDQEIGRFEKELSLMVFRVFQEIITNVVRHAGATKVQVSLTKKIDNLFLRVADNGRGIQREEISNPESFGIMGIKERVRFWGGQTRFRGVLNKGTWIVISIPLPGSEDLTGDNGENTG